MCKCFTENNSISSNQSGLKARNSCLNQLVSITHDIYQLFGEGYEVRGVFLNIAWYLNQSGMTGSL